MTGHPSRRILGVDPSTRSVAFVVLESPGLLIDWGTRTTRRANSVRALVVIRALIERFQPEIVAIEDHTSRGSRRCPRVRKLLDDVATAASAAVTVRRVQINRVATADESGGRNKYERARTLARRFPELQAWLPRFRKPWMSEDQRSNIFDALSFALACLPPEHKVVDKPETST